jgi:hypothetical protein
MEVKILISPIGRFNLAHFEGDIITLSKEFALELIELGYAEAMQPIEVEAKVIEPKTEKKVKK